MLLKWKPEKDRCVKIIALVKTAFSVEQTTSQSLVQLEAHDEAD